MPVADRHQYPLRLPRNLDDRLKKQVAYRGVAVNTYIQGALEDKLDADEARQQQRAAEEPKRKRGQDAPRGLGLGQFPAPAAPPSYAPDPAAPVVVNVGGPVPASAPGGDLVAGFADWVASGAVFERERRQHQVMGQLRDISRAQGKTSAEREALEQQLEKAISDKSRGQNGHGGLRPLGSTIGNLYR